MSASATQGGHKKKTKKKQKLITDSAKTEPYLCAVKTQDMAYTVQSMTRIPVHFSLRSL